VSSASLTRRALAELSGTGLLVAVVIGSGIMAGRLSPNDIGLELLENSLATAAGLAVLILLFGPVSGAHLNPVVSLADWALGRSTRTGLTVRDLAAYLPAQFAGAVGGAVLANLVPAAAGAWIGAAYWFTSSTSFANPAVTVGRTFSNTFSGIAAASVPGFAGAQLAGGVVGAGLALVLFPRARRAADVLPPAQTGGLAALSPTRRPMRANRRPRPRSALSLA